MNIVKILGLSFDKKKLQDLRYGKAQRSRKCIARDAKPASSWGFFLCSSCPPGS